MKIAIDAMGGDYAPEQIVFGSVRAAKKYGCEIVLVGDEEKIMNILNKEPDWKNYKISVHHTTEVIEMHEHPATAVRKKKDSSLVVATRMVKDGECDAVLSAGSTGAAGTAALLILGRLCKGIDRPTIATPIPTPKGVTMVLDSGANSDSKPQHLQQSALMGSIYYKYIFGNPNPRVGLLNIGEEETKGNELCRSTYPLLNNMKTINFIGNAEGRDIPKGNVEVVVCDGFTGNVVLKFAEGLAKTLMKLIEDAIRNGGIIAKLGALMVMPAMKKLGKRLDVAEYGGAPLLGVNGCCIICHGSSNSKSICSAIGVANDYVNKDVLNHIKETVAEETGLSNGDEVK